MARVILTWVMSMEHDMMKSRVLNRQRGGKEPRFYEYRVKRADGEIRTLEANVTLIEFMGKPASLVFNHDVTEGKMDEEALLESEARLRRSQEIAHLGSWELNLVTNHLYWSDEVFRIFGLEPQEFRATYEAFLEAVHTDDRVAVDDAYSGSLKEGRDSYEISHRVVRKSTGEVRYVHEKCEHVRDESGKIVRSIGMVQDVTDRLRLERQMRRLASFPRLNPNPVMEVDYSGNIRYVNPSGTLLIPTPSRSRITSLIGDWDDVLTQLRETQGNILQQDVEVGGNWYSLNLQLFSESEVVHVYFSDITERKKMEDKLIASNRELTRVNEKLAIMNEELESSKNDLQRYSTSLEEMVDSRVREINEVNERLRAFMEAAPDAIFIYDRNLDLVDLNRSALNLYEEGTSKKALVGKNIRELAPGIENTSRYRALFKVIETGEPYYDEVHRIVSRLGEGYASTWAFRVGGDVGIIRRDITDSVKAQDKLRESSEYARNLIEASIDPLATIDAEGKVTDVNEAMVNAVGLSRAELIGSEFAKYFTEPQRAREGSRKAFVEGYVQGLSFDYTPLLGEAD